jgi:predicted CoA-substrate-specific enzyme activase
MITLGIDIGSLETKAALMQENGLLAFHVMKTGESSREAAKKARDAVLAEAGMEAASIERIGSTGAGREEADIASVSFTEVVAVGRGVQWMVPGAPGAIDAGGESTRVMKFDDRGRMVDFTLNDKCAAGTGIFLDVIAKLMQVPVEEMGPLSLESTAEVNITSMCVVFAESEVVSQVHRQTPKVDILRGVHKSIATRIYGMVNRTGIGEGTAMVGGLARNIGIVKVLEEMMEANLVVPKNPHLAGAVGTALLAGEGGVE